MTQTDLISIAKETGFMQRAAKKIDPVSFLATMCMTTQKVSPSYNDLASRHHLSYGSAASKQAFWKRVDNQCVCFFKEVLARIINLKVQSFEISLPENRFQFKRILVQDSTIIRLPQKFYDVFSGSSNASKSVCNARIQGVYDLISGSFIDFSIDPYRKTDSIAAVELDIQKDDLVLRDRGYSTYSEIRRHIDQNAKFIYRHKFQSIYRDPISDEPINLLEVLRDQKEIDQIVCLNDPKRTPVRLLATPVNQKIVDNRRRKAKKELKRRNPSQEYLKLLGWTIYVTNIDQNQVSFHNIHQLYGLRWRIEIFFKIWKSHMSFAKTHNVSLAQLYSILVARLIMITICTQLIYWPLHLIIKRTYGKFLSLTKLTKFLISNLDVFEAIVKSFLVNQINHKIEVALVKYCTYDQRLRRNFGQHLEEFLLS